MVLIFKTAPDRYLLQAMEKYGAGRDVCILAPRAAAARLRGEFPACRIMQFPEDGMFDLSHVTLDFITRLRSVHPQKAVVLYNSRDRFSYDHIETLALAAGAAETIGLYPDGSVEDLGPSANSLAPLFLKTAAAKVAGGAFSSRFLSATFFIGGALARQAGVAIAEKLTRPVAKINRKRHEDEVSGR